ncbi:hypothetical protein M011DRAFT_489513 [Sporormia fimetaria CBS 119925]|uniref:Uncharacterized protein n=1 Tax=Sporormia fimetaria CBS 119925 TaxID=1340428 RepID=A0A6A6V2F6_9PLEO|nr:hypothetical protein M011DRAFT_489513 [Sporormia fimetaria CBS 119925]
MTRVIVRRQHHPFLEMKTMRGDGTVIRQPKERIVTRLTEENLRRHNAMFSQKDGGSPLTWVLQTKAKWCEPTAEKNVEDQDTSVEAQENGNTAQLEAALQRATVEVRKLYSGNLAFTKSPLVDSGGSRDTQPWCTKRVKGVGAQFDDVEAWELCRMAAEIAEFDNGSSMSAGGKATVGSLCASSDALSLRQLCERGGQTVGNRRNRA